MLLDSSLFWSTRSFSQLVHPNPPCEFAVIFVLYDQKLVLVSGKLVNTSFIPRAFATRAKRLATSLVAEALCQYCLILRHVTFLFRFQTCILVMTSLIQSRFHTYSPRVLASLSNIAHRHRSYPMPFALSGSALQQCMLGLFDMPGQA